MASGLHERATTATILSTSTSGITAAATWCSNESGSALVLAISLQVMPRPDVVIVGAARTPIGRHGVPSGTCTCRPGRRGKAAMARRRPRSITPDHGRQRGSARTAVSGHRRASDTVPARRSTACASGIQTIATGAQSIMPATRRSSPGGIESMSAPPYSSTRKTRDGGTRWAASRSSTRCRDGFTCSVCG